MASRLPHVNTFKCREIVDRTEADCPMRRARSGRAPERGPANLTVPNRSLKVPVRKGASPRVWVPRGVAMQCSRCRTENPAGVKFCGECGARLQALCPACQTPNPPANKFCQECGAPLAATAQPATPLAPEAATSSAGRPTAPPAEDQRAPDSRYSSPQAYTPKHLAEKILTSKSALEGERKRVTVMFSDVSGFTAMSKRLDPEEVHAIMDRAFEVILNDVHRYEGTINQFLGDGVMALFGAPIAHEDNAHRALSAALAIQQELKPL